MSHHTPAARAALRFAYIVSFAAIGAALIGVI